MKRAGFVLLAICVVALAVSIIALVSMAIDEITTMEGVRDVSALLLAAG
jgi:hypothetical protein